MDQRNWRDCTCHSSQNLRMTISAQFLRNQSSQQCDQAHRNCRKDPKPDERSPKQDEFKTADQRRYWRISYKSPIEVASIVKGLQLVPMKSILAVGCEVYEEQRRCKQSQCSQVRTKKVPNPLAHKSKISVANYFNLNYPMSFRLTSASQLSYDLSAMFPTTRHHHHHHHTTSVSAEACEN